MEFDEVHYNICAIKLLYRLLEDNTIALQNSNSENVIERARVLLKSLLDVAVEVVFETHLKVMARQAGDYITSLEQEKLVTMPPSKLAMITNISQTSEIYETRRKMAALKKDEQPQKELLYEKELSKPSNFNIFDTDGMQSRTLSSLGEENGMMQQSLVKKSNKFTEGMSPNIESIHHEKLHNNVSSLYGLGEDPEESLQSLDRKASESNTHNTRPLLNDHSEAECNVSAARFAECLEQKDDFTDDLVKTIKRIESRVLAFHLCSNSVNSSKNGTVRDALPKESDSGCPEIQRKGSASRSQLSCKRSLLEGHRLTNQQIDKSSSKVDNLNLAHTVEELFLARNESLSQNRVAYQNCGLHTTAEFAKSVYKPMHIGTQLVSEGEELRSGTSIQPSVQNIALIDRVKSLNRLVSGIGQLGNQPSECIQGLRVPLNQDDLTRNPSRPGHQTTRESKVRKTPVVVLCKPNQNKKEMSSEFYHAHKVERSTPNVSRREKLPPRQMVIKPTLLDQKCSEIKVNSQQHRDWPVLDQRVTHKTGNVEPLKTTVRPQLHELEESSSNSDTDSESSSQWTSQQDSVNTSSESEDSILSGGTQGSKSGKMVYASYEGSSEESSDSNLNKDNGHSHRVESLKSYGYHHSEKNPKKTTGGLKRLKNKLGLIFHHHHHHHHHHHDDGNGSIHSYEGPRHSMWNQMQNVFHHKNKHGMITNKKVEKTRRGPMTKVLPRKNQVGQFHRLVEGLLMHIRHSKKPKTSKHGLVKGTNNTAHGHRQNKLHWWQTLRGRRGVKLKNKSLVKKMAFINQKSLKY